jgi:hypothetical protein
VGPQAYPVDGIHHAHYSFHRYGYDVICFCLRNLSDD